jgi:surfactin synthase thioesterase subunit
VAAALRNGYEFAAESDDEDDSDTEHSLDQLPGRKPQQQQQRLVDEEELARQIAAKMARHRNKQRRAISWQGGSAVGGGQSGFSVECGLR